MKAKGLTFRTRTQDKITRFIPFYFSSVDDFKFNPTKITCHYTYLTHCCTTT